MPIKLTVAILFSGILSFTSACSPKTISTKYYYQHEKALDRVEENYKDLYLQQPFTIAFTDREFNTLSLEIITDTLSYIYEFTADESRLTDTLLAYHFNAPKVVELIRQMQSIRCTWINKLDYYVDENRNTLVLMSIKPVALNAPFSYKKYYTLTYFPQPQYFDSAGQLLDKKKLRRLRRINGEIFKRINDKVCYTISGNFR
jgi:hypothetical protein